MENVNVLLRVGYYWILNDDSLLVLDCEKMGVGLSVIEKEAFSRVYILFYFSLFSFYTFHLSGIILRVIVHGSILEESLCYGKND